MNPGKAIFLFLIMILASCSVVKQNGYYQSRKYKMKQVRLFQKSQKVRQDRSPTVLDQIEMDVLAIEPKNSIEYEISHPELSQKCVDLKFENKCSTSLALESPKIEYSDSTEVEKIFHRDAGLGVRLSIIAYFIIIIGLLLGFLLKIPIIYLASGILFMVILTFANKYLKKGMDAIKANPEKYKGLGIVELLYDLNILSLLTVKIATILFLLLYLFIITF